MRGDFRAIDLLESFTRLKKWTAECYANHWGKSEDSALRDLHYLQRLGVIACLQGRIYGHGGREPDIYFLTRLGARVLTRHLGLDANNYIQAPTVALDEGQVTRSGLIKHKVSAKPGQDAHDLACLRLGVHYRWLDRKGWRTRGSIGYLNPRGDRSILVPDFYYRGKQRVWCVEVEGTTEPEHIKMKHVRYRGMSAYLNRWGNINTHLTVVFTSTEVRQRVLWRHHRAYAGSSEFRYGLSWADLEDVLSTDYETNLGDVLTHVDYYELRERRRQYADWMLR